MDIEQNLAAEVEEIDPDLGAKEAVPSHVLTAHDSHGEVLSSHINGKDAFTILTPSLDQEKAVSLSWTGLNDELTEAEKEELSKGLESYVNERLDISNLEIVETRHFPEYEDAQNIMADSWAETGIGDSELIPTYELKAKDMGRNLLIEEFDGVASMAYMFPDADQEDVLYSHAVGAEESESGIGFQIKKSQRERALEEDYQVIQWTVDPLKPVNNRLNTTKLGGRAASYKTDVYNTETSGGTSADRFVMEWNIGSDRVENRIESGEADQRDYVPEISSSEVDYVLNCDDGLPVLNRDSSSGVDACYVGVEIPSVAVEEMDKDIEERWRYSTREVLNSLMEQGYEVTELMRPQENGFDQNTYILER